MTTSLLSRVTNTAPTLPSRVVLYAAEKFGKTSFAAHAPKPLFLMSAGETGLLSLLEAGKVPPVDHFPTDFKDWGSLIATVKAVIDEAHDYKTLVLDTGNGAEQLCADHVCDEKFGGNWADFNSYGRGNEIAKNVWAEFLALLDQVRIKRKMAVIILHHAKVKAFNDPAGKSWDQWRPEAIEKLWALTHKWADVILFGGWEVTVSRDEKATGEQRFIQCGTSGAIIAGNRYGLPDKIKAAPGAGNLWKAFAEAMAKVKGGNRTKAEDAPKPATPPSVPAGRNREPGDDDDAYEGDQTLPVKRHVETASK